MRKRSRDLQNARRALGYALGRLDLADELDGADPRAALLGVAEAARELLALVETDADRRETSRRVAELRGEVARTTGAPVFDRNDATRNRLSRLGWAEGEIDAHLSELAETRAAPGAPVAVLPAGLVPGGPGQLRRAPCHECGRSVPVRVGGYLREHAAKRTSAVAAAVANPETIDTPPKCKGSGHAVRCGCGRKLAEADLTHLYRFGTCGRCDEPPAVACSNTTGLVTVEGEARGRVVKVEGEDTATPFEARTLDNDTISAWATRREAIAAVGAYQAPAPAPEQPAAPAPESAALGQRCPRCDAAPGAPCVTVSGSPSPVHGERRHAAERGAAVRRAVAELHGTGRRIALVACGKAKKRTPGEYEARELYTGALFGDVRRDVEERAALGEVSAWYILSARHGLVHPGDWLEPYDQRMRADRRDAWAADVAEALIPHTEPGDVVEIHAGKDYTPASLLQALDAAGLKIEHVARGLQVGERRSLYATRRAERAAAGTPGLTHGPEVECHKCGRMVSSYVWDGERPRIGAHKVGRSQCPGVGQTVCMVGDNADAWGRVQ